MSEQKSEAVFIKGIGVFGLFGWYLLYNGIFNGEWINPWNLLPSAIMNAGLFSFVFGWLFSMVVFISPLFTILLVISLFQKNDGEESS
jgi:hypothetical protein